MQRLVYRKIGKHESIVAAHSVTTRAGGGGVRWYEFRLDRTAGPYLYQQGTYAPDGFSAGCPASRWIRKVTSAVGYSFGGTPNFTDSGLQRGLAGIPRDVVSSGKRSW